MCEDAFTRADQHPTLPSSSKNATCVVIVPFIDHIDSFCEQSLHALEREGFAVRRVKGFSAIDFGRSVLASQALAEGFDEILWVDSDIVFRPEDVATLRTRGLGFVAGVFVKKHKKEFACEFPPGASAVTFGAAGGVREVRYVGFGFVLTRRAVFEAIRATSKLPVCNEAVGMPFLPYFLPLIVPDGPGYRYLTEAYAFCERARQAGIVPYVDTTIRLLHVGSHGYSWDDLAGGDRRPVT